jgi:hypothetical protein
VALEGIGKLALAIGAEAAVISLDSLHKGASDNVPNVRINAIKALQCIAPLLPPQAVASSVAPLMRTMAADSDVDVRPSFLRSTLIDRVIYSGSHYAAGPVLRRKCVGRVVCMNMNNAAGTNETERNSRESCS